MGECSASNIGGNNDAGFQRVLNALFVGLGAGALLGIAFAASMGLGWLGGLAVMAIVAVGGAGLGMFIGQAWAWFTRLKTQNPDTITIHAMAECAGRNPFGLQPWTDGDWTTNMGSLTLAAPSDLPVTTPGAVTQMDEVRTRPASGSGLAHAFKSCNSDPITVGGNTVCKNGEDILHCEISSHIGSACVVGGAIGSVAGGVAGAIIGAAICTALGLVTFGIGALLCAIVIAVAFALGVWAGGALGEVVGSVVGAIQDAVTDFDKDGKTIEANMGCFFFVTGTWVTDISHQHNEIHDITAVTIVECGLGSSSQGLAYGGAVGTGRHPSGPDP
jgi:hypothetical protein